MVYKKKEEEINCKQVFRTKLEAANKDFRLKLIPFCPKCANIEYERMEKALTSEYEQREGVTLDETDINSLPEMIEFVTKFDFSRFAGDDKFKKSLAIEKHKLDPKTGRYLEQFIEGYNIDHVCRDFGHGVTLFLTLPEYEQFRLRDQKEAKQK